MTEIIPAAEHERARDAVLAALREGKVAVVPTDTAYALVGDAFQPAATAAIFDVKGRTRHVPLPVMIRSPRQALGLVNEVPESAERLMASYWPGPLTLILRAAEGLTWDLGETRGAVALRMPAHDLLMQLVEQVGPLSCSGANRAGKPVPRSADEAAEQLGDRVGVIVDGGELAGMLSTIVDLTGPSALVLRGGAVSAADVAAVASGAVPWGQRPSAASDPRAQADPADDSAEPPADDQEPGPDPGENDDDRS